MLTWGLHITNLALRGFTILLRFVLIFGIGKYYDTSELGVFGLFSATVTLLIFFLGFDFYAFSQREILQLPKSSHIPLLKNQLAFWSILYIIILPLCISVFAIEILPYSLIGWFYVVLIFEHLSQEFNRHFILINKQIIANIGIFIRSSAWIFVVFADWYLKDFVDLSLGIVWKAWAFGGLGSIVFSIIMLRSYYGDLSFKTPVDWTWIKKGFYIAIPFLVSTISYKVIEFSDRYIIDIFLGKAAVGVYSFFNNVVNVLQTFVYTVVIAEMYPRLTELYLKKGEGLTNYRQYERKFGRRVIIFTIVGVLLVSLVIFPILSFLEKQEFEKEIVTFYVLLLSVAILNIAFIPYYILYAKKMDRSIMISTIVAALINILGNIVLIKPLGLVGSAISTVLGYLAMFVFSWMSLKKRR